MVSKPMVNGGFVLGLINIERRGWVVEDRSELGPCGDA